MHVDGALGATRLSVMPSETAFIADHFEAAGVARAPHHDGTYEGLARPSYMNVIGFGPFP